jgi:hypothetical protein
VLIGWPATLMDWDILFMIPLRWWGPVLSPVLIAALICVSAVLAMARLERGERLSITPICTTSYQNAARLSWTALLRYNVGEFRLGWSWREPSFYWGIPLCTSIQECSCLRNQKIAEPTRFCR